jgi:hypothetical protein
MTSPDAPIVVTDTDDLQRMFAANIAGFTMFHMPTGDCDRLAASLIEIMRANCPPTDIEQAVRRTTALEIGAEIEAEVESRAEDMDLDDPDIEQLTGLNRAAEIARQYAEKES